MISSNSVSLKPVLIATSSVLSRESSSIPRWEMESAINTLGGIMRSVFNVRNLSENDQPDGIGKLLGDARHHASAEQLRQRRALCRADDQVIDAHRCRKIKNCRCGVFADCINGE